MADLLAVVAEPNRRRLLELMLSGERTVNELSAQFGVTRSAISQHLGVLAKAGLVVARQEGRLRYYRLVPEGMAELRRSLDGFWTNELAALVTAAHEINERNTMTLQKSVTVPLSPEETFVLLTEPDRLRRWQAVTARIDLRAGGEYRFTIVPGFAAAGSVVEVDPGKRLVMSFGWEGGEPAPGGSTVTITLEPVAGGTKVELTHEGLTEEQAVGHGEGWQHYLDRLAVAAISGDAGRDEWMGSEEPSDVLSAGEAALAVCQFILRNLTAEDRNKSTPCTEFNVHEVVEHLADSLVRLGGAAGIVITPNSGKTAEILIADAAQQALEAWRRRGTDGMVSIGKNKLPAELAANILAVELLVHGWDIAKATSQEFAISDALGEYVLGCVKTLTSQGRDPNRFADEVLVGPDAGIADRLAAYTGRSI